MHRSPADLPFSVHLEPRWLSLTSPAPLRMMSWSIHNGGLFESRQVVWHTVTDVDLPLGVDPAAMLHTRLAERGWAEAVGLLTARSVERFHIGESTLEDVRAVSVFTVGLSNLERIGAPGKKTLGAFHPGTINSFTWVSAPLSETGIVEALAMAVQARTMILLEHAGGKGLRAGTTGTGTDCVVLACPLGDESQNFAGLHTPVAHAIGQSIAHAMTAGIDEWLREQD
jgi:adenosylcobinamide amidohydrolase